MKKLSIVLFLSFVFKIAFSQSNILETIYLKNGSIVKGMIVEIIPNVSYTVRSSDGSTYVCNIPDIIRIVREPISNTDKSKDKNPNTLKPQGKGYEGLVEFGYGAASGTYGLDVIKLNIINGYRINQYFFAGGGLGLRSYPDIESVTIPVFADFRGQIVNKNNKNMSPFASISIGAGLNTSDDFFGLMINSSLGLKINTAKNLSYYVSLGYDTQQMQFPTFDFWGGYPVTLIRFSESASINVGITF